MPNARLSRLRARKSMKLSRGFSNHFRAESCWTFPPGKERSPSAFPVRDSRCKPAIFTRSSSEFLKLLYAPATFLEFYRMPTENLIT